jgi:hypothetical protein
MALSKASSAETPTEFQKSNNKTAAAGQERERERESDELKDGEGSLYTQRSRTTQSARPVTTRVFGTVGSGVPGEPATPTICGRNRGATGFETSNLLKSRGTLVRDFQFVGTESQRISRPRIPWRRGATEFKTWNLLESRGESIGDLEFVGTGFRSCRPG